MDRTFRLVARRRLVLRAVGDGVRQKSRITHFEPKFVGRLRETPLAFEVHHDVSSLISLVVVTLIVAVYRSLPRCLLIPLAMLDPAESKETMICVIAFSSLRLPKTD